MLVILHYLIPIIIKNHFLVLGEGSTKGINDSVKAAKKKKKIVVPLVKQRQNLVWVCVTTVLIVIYM